METNDLERIKYLIEKLRAITLTAQIIPFVYSALYILCMVLYLTAGENTVRVADTLFYVSPAVVAAFLIESRVLKLCKWHRSACALPLLPQVAVFIDYHVAPLGRSAAYVAVILPAAMALLLLVAAYNVFLKPKHNVRDRRKERIARDS